MHDRVDSVERAADRFAVTDVADLQLDVCVEIVGPLPVRMNLSVEVVEGAHLVAVRKQPVGEM